MKVRLTWFIILFHNHVLFEALMVDDRFWLVLSSWEFSATINFCSDNCFIVYFPVSQIFCLFLLHLARIVVYWHTSILYSFLPIYSWNILSFFLLGDIFFGYWFQRSLFYCLLHHYFFYQTAFKLLQFLPLRKLPSQVFIY